MVTVIFVIDRRVNKTREENNTIKEKERRVVYNNETQRQRKSEQSPLNQRHIEIETEREIKTEGPFGCEIEMGSGHFVKCHNCNISTICCFFRFIRLTIPLWIISFGPTHLTCSFVFRFCVSNLHYCQHVNAYCSSLWKHFCFLSRNNTSCTICFCFSLCVDLKCTKQIIL